MYTIICRWAPGSGFVADSVNDRVSFILDAGRKQKFENFLSQGLVDNTAGPNCYVNVTDEYTEACNATWKSLEAAQDWFNEYKTMSVVLEGKLLDDSGTVLDSFSNQV